MGSSWVAEHTRDVTGRRLVVIPFVIAGLFITARPSLACSCHISSPLERAAISEVVFTGVARAYLASTVDPTVDSAVVEFQVGTVYKGPLTRRIQVQALGGRGPSELGAGCGWGFQLGRQYTVFAKDHDKDGVPNTNGCFYNVEGPISAATYGLPPGQAPARNDEVVPLSIVAAIAIVALASVSLLRRRRGAVS